MKYFLSRQCYWPTGDCVVEIAGGGVDYANPDMLADTPDYRYNKLGDMLETQDPREALQAAIAIRDEWRKHTDEPVRIECGFTHGFTMPFEEEPTDEELHAWAKKAWENTPKCAKCGDPLEEDDWFYIPELGEEVKLCSSYCADKYFYGEYLDSVAEKEVHLL